jgi:putative spermidine/putrescine transport system permease protein
VATSRRRALAPALLPALLIFGALFIVPMAGLLVESFRLFTPGRVGSVAGAPFSLNNYIELLNLPFLGLFLETFRISVMATMVGLAVSYPLAWYIVRRFSARGRVAAIGFLITLILLSMLVRTYAIELTFGSVGILRPVLLGLGISPNSGWYIECLVGAGLLHYIIPVSALTLLGTVQNVDPRLLEAAQTLGAPVWRSHLTITLPLSRTGLVSAFLIAMTFSISAFVIPMVLGKGRVLFVSNTIYNRFSEIADYPSGAAISVVMLVVSLLFVTGLSALGGKRGVSA